MNDTNRIPCSEQDIPSGLVWVTQPKPQADDDPDRDTTETQHADADVNRTGPAAEYMRVVKYDGAAPPTYTYYRRADVTS